MDVLLEFLDPLLPFPVPSASAPLCPAAIPTVVVAAIGVALLEIRFHEFFKLGFDVR